MYTTSLSRKVFVQRDFSEGRVVRFASRFPVVFEGKMDMQLSDFRINDPWSMYLLSFLVCERKGNGEKQEQFQSTQPDGPCKQGPADSVR